MNALLGEIAQQQGWCCFWCGVLMTRPTATQRSYDDATIEHVIPRWLGGDKRRGNIVAACRKCNGDRGGMHRPDRVDPTGFDGWFKRRRGYAVKRLN